MSIVRRNITRVLKNATEITAKTATPSDDSVALALITTDAIYIGARGKFACRHFHFSTLNVNAATIAVKYWNGSSYVAVEDVVDQTEGFTKNGFISWVNKSDWAKVAQTPLTDLELYWVKITVSANLSAGTIIQAILNIFCDDALVRRYYPALLTDTRYLPSGRTDFLEQYEAAKDLVVLRLKQDKTITDESQIIDPNEVAVAAVHAAAFIILAPVTNREEDPRVGEAEEAMNNELNRVSIDVDSDDSGVIDNDEINVEPRYIPRGGY